MLLEKEAALATHQTGHNSGVIHSGIYYAPGSLKADLCKRGERATKEFCTEHGIPFVTCGKTLVATNALELVRMEALVDARARERDRGGAAGRSPSSGAASRTSPGSARCSCRPRRSSTTARCAPRWRASIQAAGARDRARRRGDRDPRDRRTTSIVRAGTRSWTAGRLVACAGLQSDRLARLAGLPVTHQIVPFRGEYYRLPSEKNDIIREPDLSRSRTRTSPSSASTSRA